MLDAFLERDSRQFGAGSAGYVARPEKPVSDHGRQRGAIGSV
jgi:hypothetical protein